MKKITLLIPIFLITLLLLSGCGNSNTQGRTAGVTETNPADDVGSKDFNPADDQAAQTNQSENINQTQPSMPQTVIDQNKTYTAILHTDQGDIEIALNAKDTPITANNFVWLAKQNFYNNTVFHRVIKGFMIQGGDPKGDGTGGPGYSFKDEPITGDYTRGTIAMANSGPNTNGSQFFIMHATYPLPKNYVIFGQVTKGLDVVDKIATAPVEANSTGEMSKPITPVKVNSVDIIEK